MEKLKQIWGSLFKDQDSKYFIKNAAYICLIPIVCFSLTFYSLWIFLDMNYSFFLSNGFFQGEELKEALMDMLLSDVYSFGPYFFGFCLSMFMIGLVISYFVMKPFKKIAKYFNQVEDIYEEELKFDGMNEKKLIVQSVYALVNYLKDPELPKDEIAPSSWFEHKKPRADLVFYFQYFCIICVVMLMTAGSVYLLTNELHESIVTNAIKLLKGNKSVSIFFEQQKAVLVNIYSTSILLNIALYTILAKKVIEQVDGVSFGFYRDIKQIVNGDHKKKLFPRFSDPGKNAANAINGYLEAYFADFKVQETESKPEVNNVVELKSKPVEDLPPVFVEEKKVVGGSNIYNIITPKGYKVENLGGDDLVKVLKELEFKDK